MFCINKRIVFLSDDTSNINKNELFYHLKNNGFDVKLITTNNSDGRYLANDVIRITYNKNLLDRIKIKLCLFSSLCESKFAKNYHKRNFHQKNRYLFNFIHYFRLLLSKLNLLPSYSKIVEKIYCKDERFDTEIKNFDVFIVDSLLINSVNFHPIIARVSKDKSKKLIADIYSWDNVHYSCMTYFADYYFIWNEELKLRLLHDHPVMKNKKIKHTGVQYMNYLTCLDPLYNNDRYILFAAVYCDLATATIEKSIVLKIADIISSITPEIKIYFRPYPSVEREFYRELYSHSHIVVKEFGETVSRYTDSDEIIRIDNNLQEKLNLISNCQIFISLGSTFTFEAAYMNKPIIQLRLKENDYKGIYEKTSVADHLLLTFLSKYDSNVVYNLDSFSSLYSDMLLQPEKYMDFTQYLKDFININDGGNYECYMRNLRDVLNDE